MIHNYPFGVNRSFGTLQHLEQVHNKTLDRQGCCSRNSPPAASHLDRELEPHFGARVLQEYSNDERLKFIQEYEETYFARLNQFSKTGCTSKCKFSQKPISSLVRSIEDAHHQLYAMPVTSPGPEHHRSRGKLDNRFLTPSPPSKRPFDYREPSEDIMVSASTNLTRLRNKAVILEMEMEMAIGNSASPAIADIIT